MEPGSPFTDQDNGKIAGIVSYFSIIGWLIAYFALYPNNKTSLASCQLRQTLLFHIISMVLRFGLGVILTAVWFSTGVFSVYSLMRGLYLVLFVLWIIGLIGAINGEKKEIPLIGDWAQNVFSSI